jgi:copper chaperone CopZ
MKSLSKIVMVIAVLLSSVNSFAQIKNAKTETVKIYGNCGMCKATIEKAGNVKKVASVEWNKDTKMATLTYDGKNKSG